MDLLAAYSDDEGQRSQSQEENKEEHDVGPAPKRLAIAVSAAPDVNTAGMALADNQVVSAASVRRLQDPKARQVMYNLPVEDLMAPVYGPSHPYNKDGLAAGQRNHRAGHVEDLYMHPHTFEEQYNTFHSMGYAYAPGSSAVVGDAEAFEAHQGESFFNMAKKRKTTTEKKEEATRKAEERAAWEANFDPSQPFSLADRQPWARKTAQVVELTDEQKEHMAKLEAEKMEAAANNVEAKGPTSFFHGKEDKDYQGRSWLDAPKDKRKESDTTFLPKRWVHTWSGHTKGVNAIRFFPGCGHLLLSAGLDGKVKIWDVFNGGKCMRTYLGHSKGVRDIHFSNDGRRFISTGYDNNVRVWDTETGKVLQTFNTGKTYYCVTLHPDKQNSLLAGCKDKKIYQWDLDSGDLVQEYNYHLGPVNTISFIENNKQFVTTSDDKTIRIWDFGIPVQVKYIADPSMHAIPAASMHSNGIFWLGQSMDNTVVSYQAKDFRFKPLKNKTFKGHNTAGYACQVNFSPDGKYVMSGDSEGRCFFWEWSHSHKVVRTIKAHEGVCIGAAWHPMESSKVATCGWDGLIKYWD